MSRKKCWRCKQKKSPDQFCKNRSRKDGLAITCKKCMSEIGHERRKNITPEEAKNRDLKHRYGITLDEYNDLLKRQEGRCAICNIHYSAYKRKLHVDHDHENNVVRGILCTNCNRGLGCFKDNSDFLQKAINYICIFKQSHQTS